ncbi:MAG TPA: hypothetical protein PLB62_02600, partial [Candidatus Sumerlaeota bacterium]|nr:hypothetical protein [Candidatus Sumerlaeota bacterium]
MHDKDFWQRTGTKKLFILIIRARQTSLPYSFPLLTHTASPIKSRLQCRRIFLFRLSQELYKSGHEIDDTRLAVPNLRKIYFYLTKASFQPVNPVEKILFFLHLNVK